MSSSPRLQQIFNHAQEIDCDDERKRFLIDACGNDAQLKEQVENLLDVYANVNTFLESPIKGVVIPDWSNPVDLSPGTFVHEYEILEKLGSGGHGVVYRARQSEPVRREVALKLIKPGMDTREVISRFNIERQAMALMDHPVIATILDAGPTEAGRPFFVMELVDGMPITEYCDKHRLTTVKRLELFTSICDAIQHAHQKGVIHRDLKPSNILVSDRDGRPVPKIIDFGIAKAIGDRLTEDSHMTGGGQLVGTPLYMSPEQAASRNQDVDVRSDIYSLGVLVFELLTGSTPITAEQVRNAGIENLRQLVQDFDTPRPSSRLAELDGLLDSVANERSVAPSRLMNLVHGDLDWIVLKAMAKDRERRYDSAHALAQDIKRYLANDPVEACPPLTFYRVNKFVRKNRLAVATAIAFLVVLISATGFSVRQAILASRNETIALRALKAEKTAVAQAREALASEKMAVARASEALESESERRRDFELMWEFAKDIFSSPDPYNDGRNVTVAEMLKRNVGKLRERFMFHPTARAAMMLVIGDTFSSMGMADDAKPLLRTAWGLQKRYYGPNHPETLESMFGYGQHLVRFSYTDEDLRQATQIVAELVDIETTHFRSNSSLVRAKTLLAEVFRRQDRTQDAISLLEPTVEIVKKDPGDRALISLVMKETLAQCKSDAGRKEEALLIRQEILELNVDKWGGPEHAKHATVVDSMSAMIESLVDLNRNEEARKMSIKAIEMAGHVYGTDHPRYSRLVLQRGDVEHTAGKFAEAVRFYRESLQLRKLMYPDDHYAVLENKGRIANALNWTGQFATAVDLLEDTFPVAKATLGVTDSLTQSLARELAIGCATSDHELAIVLLDGQFASTLEAVSVDLMKLGQFEIARNYLAEGLRSREQSDDEDWELANTKSMLAEALIGQFEKRSNDDSRNEIPEEIKPFLLQSFEILDRDRDLIPAKIRRERLHQAMTRIIKYYQVLEDTDEAQKWQLRIAR